MNNFFYILKGGISYNWVRLIAGWIGGKGQRWFPSHWIINWKPKVKNISRFYHQTNLNPCIRLTCLVVSCIWFSLLQWKRSGSTSTWCGNYVFTMADYKIIQDRSTFLSSISMQRGGPQPQNNICGHGKTLLYWYVKKTLSGRYFIFDCQHPHFALHCKLLFGVTFIFLWN